MDRVYIKINTNVFDDTVKLDITVPMDWDDEERNNNFQIKNGKVFDKPNEIYDFFHGYYTCFCHNKDDEIYSDSTDEEDYYNTNYDNYYNTDYTDYTDNYDPTRVVYEYWKDNNKQCFTGCTSNEQNNSNEQNKTYYSEYAEYPENVMNEELLETNAMYL
jgi:hypothetical protein